MPVIKAIFSMGIAYGAYVGAKKVIETVAVEVIDVINNPYFNPPKFDTKTDVQVKPVVPYVPTYEAPKPCTTAKIIGGM